MTTSEEDNRNSNFAQVLLTAANCGVLGKARLTAKKNKGC